MDRRMGRVVPEGTGCAKALWSGKARHTCDVQGCQGLSGWTVSAEPGKVSRGQIRLG